MLDQDNNGSDMPVSQSANITTHLKILVYIMVYSGPPNLSVSPFMMILAGYNLSKELHFLMKTSYISSLPSTLLFSIASKEGQDVVQAGYHILKRFPCKSTVVVPGFVCVLSLYCVLQLVYYVGIQAAECLSYWILALCFWHMLMHPLVCGESRISFSDGI